MNDIPEKIALVTGANRGIGFEVCRQLARKGFAVILGARDSEKGKRAAGILKGEGLEVFPLHLDVTDSASIAEAKLWTEKRFGQAGCACQQRRYSLRLVAARGGCRFEDCARGV